MSDPSVDLEKGITGLKEEEKGMTTGLKEEEKGMTTGLKEEEKGITTGLKEEEKKVVHQFKHLKVLCVKRLLDVYPVLFFVMAMFGALSFYRRTHIWLPVLVLSAFAIFNFWSCRRIKHAYIQHNTLASADSDLSTALLASSRNKPTGQ